MENIDIDQYIKSVRRDKKLDFKPEKPATRLIIGGSLGAVSGLVFGTTYYCFNDFIQLPIIRMNLGLFDLLLRVLIFLILGAVIGFVTNWMSEWMKGILLGEILLIIGLEIRAFFLPETTPTITSIIVDNNTYYSFLAIAALGTKILYSIPITLSIRFVTDYQIENRPHSRFICKTIFLVIAVLLAAGLLGAFLPFL